MAPFRLARVGAVTGTGGGGVDAPRRSTMATMEPATMAVARVPATVRRATERRHSGGLGPSGGAGSRATGAGTPTHTPKGGGRSGTPPAGDHIRDMNLPPSPATLPRLPGLSSGGLGPPIGRPT